MSQLHTYTHTVSSVQLFAHGKGKLIIICLNCATIKVFIRVRESRGVTSKPSPAVRNISKPRSRRIPHYINSSPAENPRVPTVIPRGGNPCRPLK